MTGFFELTGEVADELDGPAARGVRRDPEQMHPPGPDLDDERDIQALEREHAVDVKEVRSQQRRSVGMQEGAPGLVPVRWWRNTMSAQDLADGGGRDPVPEPAQLALDAYHSPAPVLPRQPQDQRDELVRDRRASWWPGLAPLRRSHAAVPAQQRTRGHDPACAQRLRQDPGERGKHGPVTPGQVRPGSRPAQHRDLVPEREYLRLLGRGGPRQQHEPGNHGHQQPVSQPHAHER